MMINFAIMAAGGEYPRQLGSRHYLPDGAIALPDGVSVLQAAKMRLVDGVWTARPSIAPPVKTVTAEATSLAFSGLPSGTVCSVIDGQTGETLAALPEAAGVVLIELVDAGPYLIEINPPLPYLSDQMQVTV